MSKPLNFESSKAFLRAQKYLGFLTSKRHIVNGAAALVSIVCLYMATHLYLKPSFSALLPQQLPSVEQLNKVTSEVGGTGLLLVGIESPSFRANREFADQLAAKLATLPSTKIRDIEYHFKDARAYFEKFGLYYLSTEDLSKLRTRLEKEVKERAEKQKDRAFGSFLGLNDSAEDDSKEPKMSDSNELTKKLDPRVQRLLEYPKDYLASADGKMVVIAIRTATTSLSVGEAKALTDEVRQMIDALKPKSFHPELQVNFAGNVPRSIDEVETVKHDIVDTAVLLVILILACLYIFFQSWTLVALLTSNLICALIWTMAFAQGAIGYLNTLTAFMSSLVVGTGINYSSIFISRFIEERRAGSDTFQSLARTISSTCLPTLAGSATTAVSFIALFLADNKGFSEFALIGGVGILLCWIAAFTLLPIWIFQIEKRFPLVNINGRNYERFGNVFAWVGTHTLRRPKTVSAILCVFSVISFIAAVDFLKNPFEYDFRKLGNKISANRTGPTGLSRRIQEDVYKSSLTPALVLLENSEQGNRLCSTVKEKVNKLPESERNFQGCLSLAELLPSPKVLSDETPYKAKLREEVRVLMGNKWLKYTDSKLAEIMLNISHNSADHAPTLAEMPDQLKKRFRTRDGREGSVAYVYSDNAKPLEDGKNLLNYTRTFGDIELPDNLGHVRAAGENFVLADLLRSIKIDGPKTSTVAFIGVLLIAFFLTGGIQSGAVMAATLLAATAWLFGLQALLGVKFNFLNFIALPLTFGIGIDYPINIFARWKEQGFKDFSKAMKTTGVAVFLCSSTTIIGYLTLFEASNQALISFAKLALIGEVTCLLAAFLGMPIILNYVRRAQIKKHAEEVTPTEKQEEESLRPTG